MNINIILNHSQKPECCANDVVVSEDNHYVWSCSIQNDVPRERCKGLYCMKLEYNQHVEHLKCLVLREK